MSDITTGTELDGSLGTITRTNGDISAGVAMSGAIAPPQALSGDVTTSLSLTGSLSSQTAPDGSVTTGNEIEGQIVGGPKGDKGDKGDQGDPGVVQTVVAGTDISVDNSDPANPVITNTRTSAVWGNITGTLSTQTDLQTALNAKYNASNPSGYTTNTGTVTSVGVSVPTGLQVSGSPITTSGTAAITYQTGYQGYTTAEASKLSGIADGAEVNVRSDWNAAGGDAEILNKPTIPTKTSDLTNDSSFITSAGAPVQSVNSQTGVVVLDIDDVAPSQSGNSGKVLKTNGTTATWQTDSGGIASVVAGNNIDVDNTDPLNPVVAVENLTVADITDLTATATELNYTDGVTSNIQTQLDAKANDADTVHKTGAETVAGSKTFSNDLSVNGTAYLATTNVYGDLVMKTGTHLSLDSDPTTNLQAATKQYVDNHSGNTNERLQNEDRDATYAYVGYENTSDNSWYIYRRTRATNVREYATGVSSYATNWTNRGVLSYA